MAKYPVGEGVAKLTNPKLPVIQEPTPKKPSNSDKGLNWYLGWK